MKNEKRNKPKNGKEKGPGTIHQEIPNMHEILFNDVVSILLGTEPKKRKENKEPESGEDSGFVNLNT